jgi:hypothetical protein
MSWNHPVAITDNQPGNICFQLQLDDSQVRCCIQGGVMLL